ncbi:hypothetical protein M9Y10_014808 [Tritrichomonas musculus]|uniref:Actin n=1 Tax=Tritrichomonas musculus TaxID=1915356 RepID=A0ABR2L2C3_9EUKA
MSDEVQTVIIDNGSGTIKAGYAGDEAPRSVFPTFIGRPRCDVYEFTNKNEKVYVGDEAMVNSCICNLKYPVERGIVVNWDDMEKVWNYTFDKELHINPAEHPLFIIEAPRNPKANSEKLIQIAFETFNVPSFYLSSDDPLSIYSSVRTTGVTCDIGYGVTKINSVYEGKSLLKEIVRYNFGAQDVMKMLGSNLEERGYYFTTSEEKEILRDIIEKVCYVPLDYESELRKAKTSSECDRSFFLPDCNVIDLNEERFRCTELLFRPELDGFEIDGISKSIHKVIKEADIDVRKELYANIVISGGISMLDGLPERVEKEINEMAPPKTVVKVIAPKERKYAEWIGASILASLVTFPQRVITRDKYNDNGPGIVHRKQS